MEVVSSSWRGICVDLDILLSFYGGEQFFAVQNIN